MTHCTDSKRLVFRLIAREFRVSRGSSPSHKRSDIMKNLNANYGDEFAGELHPYSDLSRFYKNRHRKPLLKANLLYHSKNYMSSDIENLKIYDIINMLCRALYNPTTFILGSYLTQWACRPPAAVPSSEEGSAKLCGGHPPGYWLGYHQSTIRQRSVLIRNAEFVIRNFYKSILYA